MGRPHQAVISINGEFLLRALGLPENCRILGARGNSGVAVEFRLEHPDLPEIEEENCLPILVPMIEFAKGNWPNLKTWNADVPVGKCLVGPNPYVLPGLPHDPGLRPPDSPAAG